MSLLRNLAGRTTGEVVQPVATSRISRAAGVRSGNVAPGQRVALPENYLKNLIEVEDRRPEVSRLGGRRDGYVHVSSLVNACARREAIAQMFEEAHHNSVLPTDRIIWAMGRAVEKHIRDQFIKAVDGQGVYGRWECACGFAHHVGMRPDQRITCDRCLKPRSVYCEEPVWNADAMLVGNCDLPFMLGDYLILTEIKSIKKDDWEKLSAPKGDHITQLGSYHRMYEESGWRVHDEAIAIYACKQAVKGTPYKEFRINCRDGSVVSQVDIVFEAGRAIKRSRENNILPRRTVCSSTRDKQAKQCKMLGRCFNTD